MIGGRVGVVLFLAGTLLFGCRAHPKTGRRIVVADTPDGNECFFTAQDHYRDCLFHRVRRGKCEALRTEELMKCPGARDVTGEPDPTVVQLPGFQP